jgi:hypothetical protein
VVVVGKSHFDSVCSRHSTRLFQTPYYRVHRGRVQRDLKQDSFFFLCRFFFFSSVYSEQELGSMRRRRAMVKKAMAHSWAGYVRYAWGFDELRPVTMDGENSFCGLGATIVDSLDTLWLMDMKEEFQRGTDWVRDVFQTEKCAFPSQPEWTLGRRFWDSVMAAILQWKLEKWLPKLQFAYTPSLHLRFPEEQ